MKFSLSIPRVFALAGHPLTGHSTNLRIRGNNTLYIPGPPPPTSTPLTWVSTIPCDLSIWFLEARRVHCTPVLFVTYPGSLPFLKYGSLPCKYLLVRLNSLMNPNEPRSSHHWLGLAQVLCRPTLSKILTMSVNAVCTQIGLRPAIRQSYE